MVLVAEDANAKLGPDIINGDPHLISDNGKLLSEMIKRQNLTIINSSEKCYGGPITRTRIANGKKEESCIDFILASAELDQHLSEAIIDCDQLYSMTKYTTTKGNVSVKRSDHYSIIAKFELTWKNRERKRLEIFKLRDMEGLRSFHERTDDCSKLRNCFQENLSLEDACNRWYKIIDSKLHQCFQKIRITDTPPKKTLDFEIYQALLEIKMVKEKWKTASAMQKPVLEMEQERCEQFAALLQGNKCKNILA